MPERMQMHAYLPLAVIAVLRVGNVVAAVETAAVVRNAIQIIESLLFAAVT